MQLDRGAQEVSVYVKRQVYLTSIAGSARADEENESYPW